MISLLRRRPKAVLLSLIALGVSLDFLVIYGAWHPRHVVGNPAIVAEFVFLSCAPFVVWKIPQERALRVILICLCLLIVARWVIGAWLAYAD